MRDQRIMVYRFNYYRSSLCPFYGVRLIKVITSSTANIVSRTILVKRGGCLADGITSGLNISSKRCFSFFFFSLSLVSGETIVDSYSTSILLDIFISSCSLSRFTRCVSRYGRNIVVCLDDALRQLSD